jgi:large subunit ribosomal protein L9
MEVILLADVERVGHEGEIVKVADGYAHNYLFPRRLAEKCTPAARRALEQRRRAIARRESEKREAARSLSELISGRGVTIVAHVGEGGRLHGQVTTQQIAEAIAAQVGATVDRRDVEIPGPIRELGEYTVSVRLYKDVRVEIPVHVVSGAAAEPGAGGSRARVPAAPEAAETSPT